MIQSIGYDTNLNFSCWSFNCEFNTFVEKLMWILWEEKRKNSVPSIHISTDLLQHSPSHHPGYKLALNPSHSSSLKVLTIMLGFGDTHVPVFIAGVGN